VVHCDVASLYPSILLSYDLKPSGDTLGVFLPLLKDLRSFRLEAKKRAREADSTAEHDYYQALQQTFKVLINSFYGYLGTAIHNFSDAALAAEVTRLGRETIHDMLDRIRSEGATPIEIDTDGIYFVPPPERMPKTKSTTWWSVSRQDCRQGSTSNWTDATRPCFHTRGKTTPPGRGGKHDHQRQRTAFPGHGKVFAGFSLGHDSTAPGGTKAKKFESSTGIRWKNWNGMKSPFPPSPRRKPSPNPPEAIRKRSRPKNGGGLRPMSSPWLREETIEPGTRFPIT